MPTAQAPVSAATIDLLDVGRHPLTATVASRLSVRCRVPNGAKLLIGVSGGADSTALLLACRALRDRTEGNSFAVDPIACHVNHALRDDAAADERFVMRLCEALAVPCIVSPVNVAAEPGNVQAAARRLRYEALIDAAREHDASAVAVAHHADDQFETLLMTLCRGAGMNGLSGMSWMTTFDGVNVVRPLLDTRHTECESLCRAAGVTWREDQTNTSPDSARARLRHEVTPILDQLWPGAAERITLASQLLDYVSHRLDEDLDTHFGPPTTRSWPRDTLRALPGILIAAGLRRAAVHAHHDVADRLTQRHLLTAADAILGDDRRPRTFNWPCGVTLTIDARSVLL